MKSKNDYRSNVCFIKINAIISVLASNGLHDGYLLFNVIITYQNKDTITKLHDYIINQLLDND